jgi:dTMP kinase
MEGIDGTGKSTQLKLLADWLRRRGYNPILTREPGGTRIGEQIRKILLASHNRELTALAELLLMYAAREQHIEEIIRPALNRAYIVLSDRFSDASFAYQGYGRKLGIPPICLLDRVICSSIQPDLTLILDAPARTAMARASKRDGRGPHQRFEAQGVRFHERVRKGYLKIASEDPVRVRVIRADAPVQDVHSQIRDAVSTFLDKHADRLKLEHRQSELADGFRNLPGK